MTFKMKPEIQIDTHFYKVVDIKNLTENTFILTLPKSRFKFIAGQHVSLSILGDYQSREYSIYSSEESENLQLLVKEVEGGYFSPKLKHLKTKKRGTHINIYLLPVVQELRHFTVS